MRLERLDEEGWRRLQAIRLAALKTDPQAFGTTYEGRVAWPEHRWREQLRALPTFVAVLDGADLGMVRAAPSEREDSAYLISMWVEPNARRRGVGAALVDAVLEWARANSKHRVVLDVREDNAGAIALYTSRGFAPTGKVSREPPPNEHIRESQYAIRLAPSAVDAG